MICRKCQNEVYGDVSYCPYCGTEIESRAQSDSDNTSSFKSSWGNASAQIPAKTNNDENFRPTTEWTPPGGSQARPKRSAPEFSANINMKAIMMVFAAVFIFSMLGVGGYYTYLYIQSRPDKSFDEPIASTAPKYSEPDSGTKDTEKKTREPGYMTISDSTIREIIESNISGSQVGVYVKNLTTGYTYGYNEKLELPASAMSYIPIMLAAADFAQRYDKDIDYDGMVFNYLLNGMEKPNSNNDDGYFFTIRDYIETVAKYGDNNRSNALVDWIGNGNHKDGFVYINHLIRQKGYTSTHINRKIFIKDEYIDQSVPPNSTCAYDIANLFDDFLSNGYLGNRAYMKRICQHTDGREQPLGVRKAFAWSNYTIANHYAINNLSQNEVASFSDGKNEVIIAVLCTLDYNDPNTNTDEEMRSKTINQLFSYIVQNQFTYQ